MTSHFEHEEMGKKEKRRLPTQAQQLCEGII